MSKYYFYYWQIIKYLYKLILFFNKKYMSKATINYIWWIEDEKKWLSLTGSCSLIELDNENGKKIKIAIDTGMFQWWKNDSEYNEIIPEEILGADYIIITHAHMDHVWKLPYIVKKWFKWKILMTEITKQCSILMLTDNVRLTKRAIEDIKKKNRKTIEKYKELLKIKNIYEKTQDRNIDKQEKNKAKSTLWKILGNQEEIKTRYQNAIKELQENNITSEQDILKILEEPPVLLYDEDDILNMTSYIKNLEIWEELKLEKTLYIFDIDNKYVEKLPEMVKEWYKKNVYVFPHLKVGIVQKWRKMLEFFQEKLAENDSIEAQNKELSDMLEKALEYIWFVDKWISPKDEDYYNLCKSLLSHHQVENISDIKRVLQPLFKAPFDKNDLEEAKKLLKEDVKMVNQKIISEFKVKFLDAWHIEWSIQAQISLTTQKVQDTLKWWSKPSKEVSFEELNMIIGGDIWRIKDPNLAWTPEVPKKEIDYYQMESTYAWRIHKNKELAKSEFFTSIRKAPGKVLVPTFSMQRTQEILIMLLEKAHESLSFAKEIYEMKKEIKKLQNLLLNSKISEKRRNEIESKIDLLERHVDLLTPELFNYEIVLDSPLSQKISQVYLTNKWSIYKLLSPWVQESIFGKKILRVLEQWQYKEIYNDRNQRNKKQIILSSGWMCQWWSILNHLVENIPNPQSTITFVWYTPPHTIWWKLKSKQEEINIWDKTVSFACRVEDINGFSGHADEEEIITFLSQINFSKDATIALTHWWKGRLQLAKKVETVMEFLWKKVKVIVPELWSTTTLKI